MKNILAKELEHRSIIEQLEYLSKEFKGKVVFSTSLGQEDQVITDMIFRNNIDIKVFTIDTGRLFEETYKTLNRTIDKYREKVHVFFPESNQVEGLVTEKGPFSFYKSVENRKECCHIRKVIPLGKALNGMKCWITGLRIKQSEVRNDLPLISWEEDYQLYKHNPLKDWKLEQVVNYLKENDVPYNPLHDKGFVSIGCAPCTRAIKPGESIRNGRWWWEDDSKKECGLHEKKNNSTPLKGNLSHFIKKI